MKNINWLIGVFFVLLMGIANASSLNGNFSVSSDCLVPGQAVFSLSNDSTETQTFTVSSAGENKDWINLNGIWIGKESLQITLSAGETKNLYAFVKPQDCYVTPGKYEITVQFSSSSENFSQKIDLTVNPSRVLNIDVNADSIELKQCEQKNLQITISNVGKSDELVSLAIEGIPKEWFLLSQEQFLLEKANSRQLTAIIKPDCSAEAKEYPFSITAKVQAAGATATKNLLLKIIDAQEIALSSDALKACSDKETNAQIKIENNGRLSDKLELSVFGIDWASIEQTAIDLNAGEEKNIKIVFKKTSASPKEFKFKLKAHSTIFDKDTEKEFSVQLQDCYGTAISSVKANGISAEIPELCIEEKNNYEFEITNDKTEAIEIDFSLKGISATIVPSKATINAGQKQVFNAALDLSNETIGDKNFEATIKSDFFSATKTNSFKTIDCYALQVDYDGLQKEIDVNASNSKANKENPFIVKIKNTGTKQVSVKATVQGTQWVYFQPDSFALKTTEEKAIYLYFDPPYDTKEGVFKVTMKISAENFSDSRTVSTNVYGGLYSSIGKANVSAQGELSNVLEQVEKTVSIDVEIKNDSNAFLQITDLNAINFNAQFSFTPKKLSPDETLSTKMTLFLGKNFNETKFSVPIKISTDKGTIVKDIQIDLNSPQKQPLPLFGLFSFSNLRDTILIALIAIVIALVLVLIFRMGTKEKTEEEKEPVSYWQAPEEKEPSKNIEEIVKQVRKKHAAKAKKRKK